MNSSEPFMKKITWLVITTTIVSTIIFSMMLMSCNRYISPEKAANGGAKCHKKY